MECITNMHVGDGEANYNIIDNEVQKDVVMTDVPVIHSSSLKGALKEHFEKNEKWNETDILHVFGGEKTNEKIDEKTGAKTDEKVKETVQGTYKFFGAKLIARPLRVTNGNLPYLLTTSKDILVDFSDFLQSLGFGDEIFRCSEENFNDLKGGAFWGKSFQDVYALC